MADCVSDPIAEAWRELRRQESMIGEAIYQSRREWAAGGLVAAERVRRLLPDAITVYDQCGTAWMLLSHRNPQAAHRWTTSITAIADRWRKPMGV